LQVYIERVTPSHPLNKTAVLEVIGMHQTERKS
jgi:hypothetical protein